MPRTFALTTSTALFALITPQIALAEVNAQDVWANYQAYIKAFGGTASADVSTKGNVTRLSDMTMSFAFPFGLGAATLKLDAMEIVENGDTTATIRYLNDSVMTMQAEFAGQGGGEISMRLSGPRMEMVASGTPGDITYTYDIEDYSVEILGFDLDETAINNLGVDFVSEMTIEGSVDIKGNTGVAQITEGEMLQITMQGGYSSVNYDFRIDGGDVVSGGQSGGSGQSDFSGSALLPANGVGLMEWPQALRDGMSIIIESKSADTFSNQEMVSFGQVASYTIDSMDNTEMTFGFDKDGLRSSGIVEGYTADMLDPEIPIPLKFALGAVDVDFAMPLLASDAPQPFVLAFGMTDLTVDESLWSMIDPGKGLPRGPATVRMVTQGNVGTAIDLLDIPAVSSLGSAQTLPFSIYDLTISDLFASALGAEVSGTGAFTFDMDDLTTFDGMPAPTGAIDFKLVGANALLDTLTGAGLIGEQDAMGARMGLGIFAVPGSGEDTLTSKIEIDGATGAISANGQRIQ